VSTVQGNSTPFCPSHPHHPTSRSGTDYEGGHLGMFRDESDHIRAAVVERGDSEILEFYTANRKVDDNVGMKEETPQSPAASPLERAREDKIDLTLSRFNQL
jgi:hypothetical protein